LALVDVLDLRKAFFRIEQDKRDDACPDILGYRHVKRHLDELESELRTRIIQPNLYVAKTPTIIDLPKRGFTLRPGVVPVIDDRILYQSLADYLAPNFCSENNVYSNRLSGTNNNQMFIPGVELWLEFQTKIEENCAIYPFVVETDLTAYYDHINHDLLLSRVRDLFGHVVDGETLKEIQSLLERLIGKWGFYGLQKFGIPQINDASSFFANLYLDELDKWLISKGLVAFRYVDDIRIFTNNEPQARNALAELIVKLRDMGLYVATGKTKIRRSSEVLSELADGRGQLRTIEAEIDTRERARMEVGGEQLRDYFYQIIGDPKNFNDRHFRFCINRFKKLNVSGLALDAQEVVINEVLNRLPSMPETTDIFVDYLSLFPDNEKIQTSVLDFLYGDFNIYPWQEMQLLELLIRSNITSNQKLRTNRFANYVINNQKHPSCKSKAYVLLGKNGTYAERRDIRSKYLLEEREDIRKSIITATQEMQASERNNFYRTIDNSSDNVHWTIDYIQSLPHPIYSYFRPPSPYDLIPDDYDSDDLYDLGSEYFL